jgi:signal transduction histidine kinase/ActR/RegA family two-component response regulator
MAELIIPHHKREAHRAGMQRYLRDGASRILGRRLEMDAMKRDGSVFPVEVRVSEVNRGPARIFTAYLSDISERVEALAAIAEERNKLEAILSATSDGILLVDRYGFVRYANKSFEELFGLSASVVERVHVRDVHAHLQQLAPLPIDVFERLLAPSQNGRGGERMSDRCSITSPVERSLMVARKPVGSDLAGKGSWLAVFRDNSRDEEIRRAKDDLVGNVSHELRTPLTAIRGFVQLLRDDRIGPVSQQQSQFLDVISENVDRLMQLVSDLLDVDRVERVPLRADDVAAREIVEEAVASEAARAEAKGLDLAVDVDRGLMLVGDRERLVQVFQHLLSNAVRYTKEGGVTVVGRPDGLGMAVFEIRDTGVGMTEKERALVFDRFFRGGNEYVREAGGTGLGLSIVRTLVERHGGTIDVESTPGRGSCFKMTLPRDSDAVSAAIAEATLERVIADRSAPATGGGSSPLVLLVEDSGPVRTVLAQGLELEGLTVISAERGHEALKLARRHVPDVVLLDLTLPDMDGWTVLETLRSDSRFARTRILVVSGYDEPDKALQRGADGFIAKPVDVLTLSEEIHRMTRRMTTAAQALELT